MPLKKLPWDTAEYAKLDPEDLLPFPAPTDDQRVRVAAAIATLIRDENMLGKEPSGPNIETVRAILLMSAEQWARDVVHLRTGEFTFGPLTSYDSESPEKRYQQVVDSQRN